MPNGKYLRGDRTTSFREVKLPVVLLIESVGALCRFSTEISGSTWGFLTQVDPLTIGIWLLLQLLCYS